MDTRTFSIGRDDFLLDGEPFQVISGALHYFRTVPELWADRLRKARQLGLNTVETYVAWNFHSEREGQFRTDGWRDLGRFIDLAAAEGLQVIIRPGPYICAEWSSGGLPDWLLSLPGVALRRSDPTYLAAVSQYYLDVLDIVVPRQVTRGGNVIMVQIENEYGAYGDDAEYLRALTALATEAGVDTPMITCDQANDHMLARGGIPELHRTATFGSRSVERLRTLREHQRSGPLMCMEYWDGWFDSWGAPHHVTDAVEAARDLDALLASGASVNLYMFHGGTNFGTSNGANDKGTYRPVTTSYDYDAPLAEDGTPTAKYWAFREVISRYAAVPQDAPSAREPAPELTVDLDTAYRWPDVRAALGEGEVAAADGAIELPGTGVALAEMSTAVRSDDDVLVVDEIRDRADVAVDDVPAGVLDRSMRRHVVALPPIDGTLTLLLEDRGRVNYGTRIGEPKGVFAPRTATRTLETWRVRTIPLDGLPAVLADGVRVTPVTADAPLAGPIVLTGSFTSVAGVTHFLRLAGWTRGFVWVNGFLLGRYSSEEPTRTLYVPGTEVTEGVNTLTVLELAGTSAPRAAFVSAPDLGPTE